MIEKIIIQDSSQVHSVWIPERRSMASFLVWKSYGLGHYAHWRDGQITLGTRVEGIADPAEFLEFPGYMNHDSIPDWVDNAIGRIDASLPSSNVIMAALDEDSVTLMFDPPAFSLPRSPSLGDAATCMLAGRLLLSIRQHLIMPITSPERDLIAEIDFASRLAALLGGESASNLALSVSKDPELYAILPEFDNGNELILRGQDNG